MFERQCQYSLLFGRLKGLINPMFELQESGTVPPCIYPHVYLTSRTQLNLPGIPPLFLHTASDKKTGDGNDLRTRLLAIVSSLILCPFHFLD